MKSGQSSIQIHEKLEGVVQRIARRRKIDISNLSFQDFVQQLTSQKDFLAIAQVCLKKDHQKPMEILHERLMSLYSEERISEMEPADLKELLRVPIYGSPFSKRLLAAMDKKIPVSQKGFEVSSAPSLSVALNRLEAVG